MPLFLTDLIPTADQIDPDVIVAVRKRLATIVEAMWPELDSRPNSPFGDLHLTPLASLLAGCEMATARLISDVSLSNVARGIIYNEDFVKAFLQNFGVSVINEVPASGSVKLVFNADMDYELGLDEIYTFGESEFRIIRSEGDPVVISNTQALAPRRVLTKTAENEYTVFLPVSGPSGAFVASGDSATTTVAISNLLSVSAAGDFDSGLMPDTTPMLAMKAQKTFASANLTNRSGVISFLAYNFPQMLGASAIVTGDREMLRAGVNPLGIQEGAVDIFVRSKATYANGEAVIPLIFNTEENAWQGLINLPVTPSFFSYKAGIFQVGNYLSSRGVNKIYSKSAHPLTDSIGLSYSRWEKLGIRITDTNPADFIPSSVGAVLPIVSDGSILAVTGEYYGDIFGSTFNRTTTIRFDTLTTVAGYPAISVSVKDDSTNEYGTVYFRGNTVINPTQLELDKTVGDYTRMFGGLSMSLTPPGALALDQCLGFSYRLNFQGRTANFDVSYLYDATLVSVDAMMNDPDVRPVNVSPLVRSFIPCHIQTFVVNYRIPFGARLDLVSARQAISNYINSVANPRVYEESQINSILSTYGGASLISIQKLGYFYPSLASVYVDKNGVESALPKIATTTLFPDSNDFGFSLRNVTYLIEPETIVFNASVI